MAKHKINFKVTIPIAQSQNEGPTPTPFSFVIKERGNDLGKVLHFGERTELDGAEALDPTTFSRVKIKPRSYLREIKMRTFDERGRFLLSAIGAFLGESSLIAAANEERESMLSYSKDFENIWERVMRDLMAPGLTDRTLPQGEWHTWPDAASEKGMQPVFDIRLDSGDADVLVDAKDYRILKGEKWLGLNGDHYKQIIYGQLAIPTKPKVVNILAFPSIGQKSLFAIHGCHSWNEIEGSRIFEVTVDYDLAIKRWLRETSLDVVNETSVLLGQLRAFGDKLDTLPD